MSSMIESGIKRSNIGDGSLIPMINVVFLLLIFFMIAGHIAATSHSPIALPETEGGKNAEKHSHQLEVTLDRQLLLNGEAIQLEQLPLRLFGSTEIPANKLELMLVADKNLKAVDLDEVFQQLQQLGLASVTLLTRARSSGHEE